ncbi:MAG: tetratricopeptide repeat protein [Porphyromonadaceae bacterium]|nr:tetratricopeptide repeat protein [Porphyromonadaceae bacterium]
MDRNIENSLRQVRDRIKGRKALCAAASLRSLLTSHPRFTALLPELDRVVESYNYMAAFMFRGTPDQGRERFFRDTLEALSTLTRRAERLARGADAPGLYYAEMRTQSYSAETLPAMLGRYADLSAQLQLACAAEANDTPLRSEREALLIRIFNYVWVTMPLTDADFKLLTATAADPDADFPLASQIITALFLGALQYYERGRLLALLDIYDGTRDLKTRARALMALALALYATRAEAVADDAVSDRLEEWKQDDANLRRLRSVIMEIVRTLDTERVTRNLRSEMMTDIKEMRPVIERLMRDMDPGSEEGYNPDWEEMLRNSGLEEKLSRLGEMQEEGADMMYLAFSNLKNFPFFRDLPNWFLPFDGRHTQLRDSAADTRGALSFLLETPGLLCDSDKYSLALSVVRMPQVQKEMLTSQMGDQMEQVRQAMAEAQLHVSDADRIFNTEALVYVRDINRFLKLFRAKGEFTDILCPPFTLGDFPYVSSELTSDAGFTQLLGEFYLKRGYYGDARDMFSLLEQQGEASPGLYEKLAYAHEKQGNLDQASLYLRKAELFNPDSRWLVKRIAAVSRALLRYDDAEEYYRRALEQEPDSVPLNMQLAGVLLALEKHEEARKLYYKVNYLHPGHLDSLRGIAWCEFMLGDLDRSLDHYAAVLADDGATHTDHLNAGHAFMRRGETRQALDEYRRGVAVPGTGKPDPEKLRELQGDRSLLVSLGVPATDFDITCDLLAAGKGDI